MWKMTSLRPGFGRAAWRRAACLAVAFVAFLPLPLHAQRRPQPSRLYVGMWTTHLNQDVVTLDANWAVGLAHRGYFGATFLNSFGKRAYAGGLQRTVLATDPRFLSASLGFRLGFITGYDGRLMAIARKTPVLPLIQPFGVLDVGPVGFDVSFTFVVASVALSYKF